MQMSAHVLRQKYLDFFASKGHKILPSASLIPGDPSLLLTAAGMVPFKPYFTGEARPDYTRVTTCQKCARTPDIDRVGKTARHATFFEMLGNFSFNDYFKEEAISWGWEFVTEILQLPKDKLWVSIYLEDDEAFEIWNKQVGVPAERIVRLGKADNFWEIGVGPCGPCSEIYIDRGESFGCGHEDCKPGCDCDRFLEFWNLVFIQFYRGEDGTYSPLKQKGIDTGMGLDRAAAILQGVESIFDIDIIKAIVDFVSQILGTAYGKNPKDDVAIRVITDHARGITFMIADGILPSNEGRGYILRRLLRRAVRFGRLKGVDRPFLTEVAVKVIEQMGKVYPELEEKRDFILKIIKTEEESFIRTLEQGLSLLGEIIDNLKKSGESTVKGDAAFKLYDTYGFPLELTQEIAEESGIKVDIDGFNAAMEEQKRRARQARKETEYISERNNFFREIREKTGETVFVGYEILETEATIKAILKDGLEVDSLQKGEEAEIILDKTPFYAESGGQLGDKGFIEGSQLIFNVDNCHKPVENLFVHCGKVNDGELKVGDKVRAKVNTEERVSTARNHSATHLLHSALKIVLGNHINQAGSLVTPDRLRFDFTHFTSISEEDLKKIENIVNAKVLEAISITVTEQSLDEARKMGATALFSEKYGSVVRVVQMGDFSIELCGGTHLGNTSRVGLFKIIKEEGIAAGTRRIEAITGKTALAYINSQGETLDVLSAKLKTNWSELPDKLEKLLQGQKELEKEIEKLKAKMVRSGLDSLLAMVEQAEGFKYLVASMPNLDMEGLRSLGDMLKEKIASGVIILGSELAGKVNFITMVSPDLTKMVQAGALVKEVAKVAGGGGGGKPEMAQAGGKDPAKLEEALQKGREILRNIGK